LISALSIDLGQNAFNEKKKCIAFEMMHNLDYELILILKIKRLRERALGKKIVLYYKSFSSLLF
jgi:hypothetical protein